MSERCTEQTQQGRRCPRTPVMGERTCFQHREGWPELRALRMEARREPPRRIVDLAAYARMDAVFAHVRES